MQSYLSIDTLLIVTVVSYIAHLVLSAILLHRSESTRIELISVGNKLIAREDIDERRKQFIQHLLGTVFSWRFLIVAILFFAMVPMKKLLNLQADKSISNDEMFMNFYRLHLRATIAANPILALILRLILFLRRLELNILLKLQENKKQKNKPTTVDLYKDLNPEHLLT